MNRPPRLPIVLLVAGVLAACGPVGGGPSTGGPRVRLATSTHALSVGQGKTLLLNFLATINPPKVGGVTVQATDFTRHGNRVYVTYNNAGEDSRGALQVVGVAKPEKPTLDAEVTNPTGDLNAVAVKGNNAFVVGAHAVHYAYLWVYDVTPSKTPRVIGELSLPSFAATSIEVQGNVAMVTTGDRAGGVATIDIRKPESPVLKSFFTDEDARHIGSGVKLKLDAGKGLWARYYALNTQHSAFPGCTGTCASGEKTGVDDSCLVDCGDIADPTLGRETAQTVDGEAFKTEEQVGSIGHNNAKDPFKTGSAAGCAAIYTGFINIERAGYHTFKFIHNGHIIFSINGKVVISKKATKKSEIMLWDHFDAGFHAVKLRYLCPTSGAVTLKWEHAPPDQTRKPLATGIMYDQYPEKGWLLAVLSGNPGRLSLLSVVSGKLVKTIPIKGIKSGITAPSRFDTDGGRFYVNTDEAGLLILDGDTFQQLGQFKFTGVDKGNDVDVIANQQMGIVANGAQGLAVLDLNDLSAIKLLDGWDVPIDSGSANRVRLLYSCANSKSSHQPIGGNASMPACGHEIGFLADGLGGLKLFQVSVKSQK